MVTFLVTNGANPDVINKDGHTALMLVAKNKLDMRHALGLVHPGVADLDLENKKGESATSIEKAAGYQELYNYLNGKEAEADSEAAIKERNLRSGKSKLAPANSSSP